MDVLAPILLLAAGLAVGFLVGRRRRADRPAAPAAQDEAVERVGADLARIADALPFPVVVLRADHRIAYANGTAATDRPELAPGTELGAVSATLRGMLERLAAGEPSALREPVILGDPPRTYRVAAAAVGERTLALLVDATEEVDFEESRRNFSAAVSHELRTPLARILGLAESLALPDIGDERVGLVTQIENEVEGIRKLIDEMLLLAALDRGRLAVADGIVDASATTRRAIDDARQRRIGRSRSIELTAEEGIEVPLAARLFEVVVQNLLDNALLHGGPDAAIEVDLRRVDGRAQLTVADTGVGIPAQHLPFVFQRFYRGDASRTGSGTGLGLALVKHIVEAHAGTVVAESDGETGTTVRVTLPLSD